MHGIRGHGRRSRAASVTGMRRRGGRWTGSSGAARGRSGGTLWWWRRAIPARCPRPAPGTSSPPSRFRARHTPPRTRVCRRRIWRRWIWRRWCGSTGCASGSSRATSRSNRSWAGPTSQSALIAPSAAIGRSPAAPALAVGGLRTRSRVSRVSRRAGTVGTAARSLPLLQLLDPSRSSRSRERVKRRAARHRRPHGPRPPTPHGRPRYSRPQSLLGPERFGRCRVGLIPGAPCKPTVRRGRTPHRHPRSRRCWTRSPAAIPYTSIFASNKVPI